jgi:GNAT superfamily N-acetyltransferase
MPDGELAAVLAAYRLPLLDRKPDRVPLRVTAMPHAELGLLLKLQGAATGVALPVAHALLPLDDLLIRRALTEAAYAIDEIESRDLAVLVAAVQRIGDLLIDHPLIGALDLRLGSAEGDESWVLPGAAIALRSVPLPERRRLLLAPYPAELEHVAAMRSGERYLCRPVRPPDEPALLHLLEHLPAEDVRLRFFHAIRHFTHAMAARMTQIDYDRELTLIALRESAPEQMAAIGTLLIDPDNARAEFAVLVAHSLARAGVGRHLLAALIEHARMRGVGVVYGDVLRDNAGMRGLARALGFRELRHPDEPECVRVELATGTAAAA